MAASVSIQGLDIMLLGQILIQPLLETVFGLLSNELIVNLVLYRGQWLFAGFLMFLNLDDVEAVASVNQRCNVAGLGLLHRFGDLIVEVVGIEFAQFSTLGLGIIVGVLTCQLAKIRSFKRPGAHFVGFFFR